MSNNSQILNSLRDYANPQVQFNVEEINSMQSKIEEVLHLYKFGYMEITLFIGPTTVRFEIIPAEGIKMSEIKALKDDMSMSLCAFGARIIAPIPGKGVIGIETPHRNPQIVGLKRILESEEFNDNSLRLPIACGIGADNKPIVADLARMPHLLIGGATGTGKSVFLNTLIVSLMYSKSPDELKFLLIDPKWVEFCVYNRIKDQYHVNIEGMDNGVVTDSDDALCALGSLVAEMERRYGLLKSTGVRTISEYNSRTDVERLPYIVAIIDEYADLIMTYGKEIETPLIRLAQKSRAVGIHLVVATQRPSTNVISAALKANFPVKIAFKVNQRIDSKTILDQEGANSLIGRGDMLMSVNGKVDRMQAPFIDLDEIDNVCKAIATGVTIEAAKYTIAASKIQMPEPPSLFDPLFNEAAMLFIGKGYASTSELQRAFNIGYNRAGRIVDQLEAEGIIGPVSPPVRRPVLISAEDFLEKYRAK